MNRIAEIFLEFFKLGFTSFGGPSAHIVYFRERFVEAKKWIGEEEYASILALTQFLPGPGSSQMGMAIGWLRGGILGSLAAFAGFTLPSGVLMGVFALGVIRFGLVEEGGAGWIRGLQIAVVAVIANAVWGMSKALCPDRVTALIALAAAAVILGIESVFSQVAVIGGGALAGWILLRRKMLDGSPFPDRLQPASSSHGLNKQGLGSAAVLLIIFTLLLVATPWLVGSNHSLAQAFGGMYRSGALVFGGGHVVLPLLSQATVDTGWIGDAEFAAGYGAVQAVPGPLFTISSYLGGLLKTPGGPILSAVVCTLAIFLPGWLLTLGCLPFWERLRQVPSLQRALSGANAAVVGLLGAALYDPVWTQAINTQLDAVFLLGVVALLLVLHLPAWAVVIAAGLVGHLVF